MNTTRLMNYAKSFDEMIPDATTENVVNQCRTIGKDAKDTGMCIVATCMMASKTLMDTTELGLMVSKTVTKKAYKKVKEFYNDTPAMTIRR